ncbi:MAG TPA: alpha/beta-hydrolase family protein, partial [Thermoleophilia bacterium]
MPAIPKARAKLFSPPSYGAIVGALVFFGFSLTPSLLPRSPLLQGLVSGVSLAGGYGLGALVFWAGAKAISWRPTEQGRRIAWIALAVAGVAFVVPALYVAGVWNNQTRELMTLDPVSPWTPVKSVPIALLICLFLLVIARLLRWLARAVGNLLSRWLPRNGAIALGAVIVAVPLLVAFSVLLTKAATLADDLYGKTNDTTAQGATKPTSSLRSGGPGSLVTWDSLGMQGRNFIGRGPDAATLEQFSGRPATEPIRVYVGVESAPTAEERASLAVKELDRTDAWSRKALVVMGTTGTGWIEPQSSNSLEYLWNGDTAEVTIQYSYLPSWISFLVDKQRAEDAGQALFTAVRARWARLPADKRPKLLAYGLSLGSFAQQAAFPSVDAVTSQTGGAVFVGTPNDTALWRDVEVGRDPGS